LDSGPYAEREDQALEELRTKMKGQPKKEMEKAIQDLEFQLKKEYEVEVKKITTETWDACKDEEREIMMKRDMKLSTGVKKLKKEMGSSSQLQTPQIGGRELISTIAPSDSTYRSPPTTGSITLSNPILPTWLLWVILAGSVVYCILVKKSNSSEE
jgi:hypothetical protein